MADLLDGLVRTIRRYGMVSPGDKVLAAVSGGPDSMAMLYALDALSGRLGITLAVAHLDHGMRDGSELDAAFVVAAADNLGVDCVTKRIELGAILGPGANRQAGARDARYAFLEDAAGRLGADRIAVAHTMDDQAETCLMRELRGSGARGLGAIPPVRGRVIRPLIDVTREEVMDYLSARGVGYRTDPTNLKTDYFRNRLRIELMPLLREYNPNIIQTLARGADIMRDEDSFLDGLASEELSRLTVEERGWLVALELEGLSSLHPALGRRVLRLAVERLRGDVLGIGFSHVDDALGLLKSGGTGRGLDLPGGIRVENSYDRALVYLPDMAPGAFSVPLEVPGEAEIPEAGLVLRAEKVSSRRRPKGAPFAVEYFDADRLAGPLTVRSRRPGDCMHPAGMDGRKKLKELFIDMKVPRLVRDTTPVVECGGEVAWVVGVRADARFAPGKGSKRLVRISAYKAAGK